MAETKQNANKATFLQHVGLWGYKLFCLCLRLTDIRLVALFGRMIGYLVWACSAGRRKIVARNFRIIVSPELREDKLRAMVRRNMVRTTMNLACSLRTGLMSDREMARSIHMEGAEHFESCGMNGHCAISCIPHAGNWEILARIRPQFKKVEHFGSMYRRMSNPLLEEMVYKSRTAYGCEMFSKEEGLRSALKLARTGGLLGVLSDQFTQEGLFLPYFGKVTGVTPLPALIYKRCKGKGHLLSVFTRNTRLGCWDAVLGRELTLPEGCESMAAITMEVNKALEKVQKEDILDGFWMHHRWKSTANFAPKQDEEVIAVAKANAMLPFRIIVCLPETMDEALQTEPMLRALKACRFDAQLTVICPTEQCEFWKQEPYISHVVTTDSATSVAAQLDADAIYKDGPFDILFMLSDNRKVFRDLRRLEPIYMSTFASNPLCRKYKKAFRTRYTLPMEKLGRPRTEHYLAMIRTAHGIAPAAPSEPCGNPQARGNIIAPFSSLGEADSWPEEKWKELISRLPEGSVSLMALPTDKAKAEALAAGLQIPCICPAPEEVRNYLGAGTRVYAVDGVLPQLAAHCGSACTVLMGSRDTDTYKPSGKNIRTVHHHTPCHPCYLERCDQGTGHCLSELSVDDVLNA